VDTSVLARTRGSAPLALAAGGGVLAGIAAKAADESPWRWAADAGTYPAAWVLVVAVIGWAAPSPGVAALRSAAFFAAMTLGYYGWAAAVLGFGWQPDLVAIWLLLSATAVAATGAVVHWATRRAGWLPGALLGVPAGLVLGSGAVRQTWLRWNDPALAALVPARPVQTIAELVTVVALVAVLPVHRSTRLWALLWVLPATWLAPRVLDLLHQLV